MDNIISETPSDKFALAERLALDGKSSDIKRTYIDYPDGKRRFLGIPSIEDRCKTNASLSSIMPTMGSIV